MRQSKARSVYLRQDGAPVGVETDWEGPTITRRGKFSIRVPQSEEGSTFRVKANGVHHERVGYKCKADVSRRFTLLPPS
jgi:hypothetical protein